MKTLTTRQFATVKRVAQNVNPLVVKKNKLMDKINAIREEIEALNDEILGHEMGIKALTGGLISEDLITKKVEDTGKVDKDGRPIKITKYEPKEGAIAFNEETKVYEILVGETSVSEEVTPESIDDTETVPEVEVNTGEEAPINPISFE